MSAATASTEIQQGQRGSIGAAAVGVGTVAADGSSAEIVIADRAASGPWELRCDVRPGEVVAIGATLVPVARITAPGLLGGGHGAVAFGEPVGYLLPDQVTLGEGARLRIDGPSVLTATDVSALAFLPDPQQPGSARLEWLPAKFAKENTPPADIHERTVHAGDAEAIGHALLTVERIEGAGEHHPARLLLRLSRRAD